MFALRCSRCTSRQRRARTPVNASLKRSPTATALALQAAPGQRPSCSPGTNSPQGLFVSGLACSVMQPTAELATRCALRSDSRGESETKRAARAAACPVLLSALEAHCRVSAHAFAVAFRRTTVGKPVPGFAAGGARRGRSLRWREAQGGVSARASALRALTHRDCLSVAPKRVASFAARPTPEHRSGVFAKRKPPQCEPPPGTACREAAREVKQPIKTPTAPD